MRTDEELRQEISELFAEGMRRIDARFAMLRTHVNDFRFNFDLATDEGEDAAHRVVRWMAAAETALIIFEPGFDQENQK